MMKKVSPHDEPDESPQASQDPRVTESARHCMSPHRSHRNANGYLLGHARGPSMVSARGKDLPNPVHSSSWRLNEENPLPWKAMASHSSKDLKHAFCLTQGVPTHPSMQATTMKHVLMPQTEAKIGVDALTCLKLASAATTKPAPKPSTQERTPTKNLYPTKEDLDCESVVDMNSTNETFKFKNKSQDASDFAERNAVLDSSKLSFAPRYSIHACGSAKSAAVEALETRADIAARSSRLQKNDRLSHWYRSGLGERAKPVGSSKKLYPDAGTAFHSDSQENARPGLTFVAQSSFKGMKRDIAPKKPTSSRFLDCASDDEDGDAPRSKLQPVPWMQSKNHAGNYSTSKDALGPTLGSDHTWYPKHVPKNHSMSSCSPPALPIRRGSNHGDIGDNEERSLGGNTAKVPSGACSVITNSSGVDLDDKTRERIIAQSTSMYIARRQSGLRLSAHEGDAKNDAPPFGNKEEADKISQSAPTLADTCSSDLINNPYEDDRTVTTNSSGIELDEGVRNKIVSRSTSLHVARRRRSSLGDDVKVPPPMSSTQPGGVAIRRSSSKTSSIHSADRKLSVSSESSSIHSRRSSRSTDEKAVFRKSFHGVFTQGADMAAAKAQSLHLAAGSNNEKEACLSGQALGSISSPTLQDGNADEQRDLEAQAGVPVALPGAFAVRPRNLGEADDDNDGHDSGLEDDTIVLNQENGQSESLNATESQHHGEEPIFQPIATDAPVQAELYELELAEAQVLEEDAHETAKGISEKFRFLQTFLVLLVITLVVSITMAVVYTREGDEQGCGNECSPIIRGWTQVGSVLRGPTNSDGIEFGYSVAMSSDGNRLAIGLPGLNGRDDPTSIRTKIGGIYIMDYNGTEWVKTSEMLGMDVEGNAGSTVALSDDGKIVAIGAPGAMGRGSVTVYHETNDGSWKIFGTILGGHAINGSSAFGSSLALSAGGDVLAVGDRYAMSYEGLNDAGSVLVYKLVESSWQQMGNAILGEGENDLFGWSIALSAGGDRVVGSALGSDGLRGQVRVFEYQAGDWIQVGSSLSGGNNRETFGATVDLGANGNVLAVGAPGYSNGGNGRGRVQVFEYDTTQAIWQQLGNAIEGDDQFDRLGFSVSLSVDGGVLAVGSPENDTFGPNAGFVKMMHFDNGVWTQIGSVLGQSESSGGLFGSSIAQSGDGSVIVAGAPAVTYDGKVSRAGLVWIYEQDDIN